MPIADLICGANRLGYTVNGQREMMMMTMMFPVPTESEAQHILLGRHCYFGLHWRRVKKKRRIGTILHVCAQISEVPFCGFARVRPSKLPRKR